MSGMLRLIPSTRAAIWRRLLLLSLVAGTTAVGVWLLLRILWANGLTLPEAAVVPFFALAFAWVVLSFWCAVFGFVLQTLGRHPITLRRESAANGPVAALTRRHAILFPVFNEDSRRVFAGIAATWQSLRASGVTDAFELFVLSDSTRADARRAERSAWTALVTDIQAQGRIHYRNRRQNLGRKAGNIGEWVATRGADFETMTILDADSVMSGDTLRRLAALMEANPEAGIIQTLPLPANRRTLFARALQFANHLVAPMLATGQSFWQLGEANYYGHNAILRVSPFAAHCRLPVLPGRPPLGGELLSHDFVEAALLRRAGWFTWQLPELGGSFEEVPSNLVDYGVRDRRWVQGNLQHLRLLGLPGLHWISRLHLAMGVMAFLASPLWLGFLLFSSLAVIEQTVTPTQYFPEAHSLFPVWPEYRPAESYSLLGLTTLVLLAPRGLALLLALRPTRRSAFGGLAGLLAGVVAETLLSLLLAPVMMMLHSRFVATIVAGQSVAWGTQPRADRSIPWALALRLHAGHLLAGLAWGYAVWSLAPDFLWWIAPVVVGLVLASVTDVLSSRQATAGCLAAPEELRRPAVLVALDRRLSGEQAEAKPMLMLPFRPLAAKAEARQA